MGAEFAERPPGKSATADAAMGELVRLLEQAVPKISPDAVWLSGNAKVYAHLRDIEALALSTELAPDVLCHECCESTVRPERSTGASPLDTDYRGLCVDCGWIELSADQARLWQAQPAKLARWLANALRPGSTHQVECVIEGTLWRLGEMEFRRKRRTLFFGRCLAPHAVAVRSAMESLSAPGAEVLITTSDIAALRCTSLADRRLVPLRAIAHLRKAGIVVENLDAYVVGTDPIVASDETSLRLMRTRQVALIDGEEHRLSQQVCTFLQTLEDAGGDEVSKRKMATALGVDTFRLADVFKRHKPVLSAFVAKDGKGNCWLKPEFVSLE